MSNDVKTHSGIGTNNGKGGLLLLSNVCQQTAGQGDLGSLLFRSRLVEVHLGRPHVLLGPEYHGSCMTKGHGSEADMFMVVLVPKIPGTRDVVKYGGWPGAIVSVRCKS